MRSASSALDACRTLAIGRVFAILALTGLALAGCSPTQSKGGTDAGQLYLGDGGILGGFLSCADPKSKDGDPCNDGNACTQTDTCQAGKCVGGDPVTCATPNQCQAGGVCDPWSGKCSPIEPVLDGTTCDDGNACTQADSCRAGACVGTDPVVCVPSDGCHAAGTCDMTTGMCSNPTAPDGTVCSDGNFCTQTDTCQAGTCVGSNPVVCTAPNDCQTPGTCDTTSGQCSAPTNVTNGTSCNDGDACTRTDACQAGACVGSDPVVCTASDQCHVAGVCDSASGTCSNPNALNGTTCSDGNACTTIDSCQAGTCVGGSPVVCAASDQCHAVGTCNMETGVCSNPTALNGTLCSDNNPCTTGDACMSGSCQGTPVVCTASDQCHTAGTCDMTSGTCSNPSKMDGTMCSDGNACTQGDACMTGTCVGGAAVTCTASDQCHTAGTCDPTNGCPNPAAVDGTACNDGNVCTQVDQCMSGVCTGSSIVTCTALDSCHSAGTCDPTNGCSNPNATDGTACTNASACAESGVCQTGNCLGVLLSWGNSGSTPSPYVSDGTDTSVAVPVSGSTGAEADVIGAYDSADNLAFAAWADSTSNALYAATCSAGTWSTGTIPLGSGGSAGAAGDVSLVSATSGEVIAAWVDSASGAPYASVYASGTWAAAPSAIPLGVSTMVLNEVTLAFDNSANVYAAWADAVTKLPYVSTWNGTTWSTAAAIPVGASTAVKRNVYLTADASGNIYAAWTDSGTATPYMAVYTAATTTWAAAAAIPLGTSAGASSDVTLAADSSSNIYAAWVDASTSAPTFSIYSAAAWQAAPGVIPLTTASSTSVGADVAVFIAFDGPAGQIWAAWADFTSLQPYLSTYSISGAAWTTTVVPLGTSSGANGSVFVSPE